jgi:hypothetical protein
VILSQSIRTVFNGTDVTATTNYTYGVGWVRSKADKVAVHMSCATLNASSLSYRIEGKFTNSNYDRVASLAVGSLTSAQDIDKIIAISNYVDERRVGVKANNSATPNNFYSSVVLTEYK